MNAPEKYFENLSRTTEASPQGSELLYGIDPIAYARFVHQAHEVKTTDDFISLINTAVQPILPHEMLLAGIGYACRDEIVVQHAIGINYPRHHVEKLSSRPILAGPLLSRWLNTREPQQLEVDVPHPTLPTSWLGALRRHRIRNLLADGVRDLRSTAASYFTFSNIKGRRTAQDAMSLRPLVPHLHHALLQSGQSQRTVQSVRQPRGPTILTDREREVLSWIVEGKSNAAIAKILGTSVFTVRNQVSSLMDKLGAESRAHVIRISARLAEAL